MLTTLIIMTLLVGFLSGFVFAVWLAIHMDEKTNEMKRRQKIHPSGRDLSGSTILDYSSQN